MRIPLLRLQKHALKTATREAILSKGKQRSFIKISASIQSEKPAVNFRLESDFLLSFSLCGTKNVAQPPILLEKKKKKLSEKPPPGILGSGNRWFDCKLSNGYPQHMFLWRTDKKYPSIITSYPLDLVCCLCVTSESDFIHRIS